MVNGVIFDMDGTMFGTEHLSTITWKLAGEELGIEIGDSLIDSFRGRNPYQIRKMFLEALGPCNYDQVKEAKHRYLWQIIDKEGVPVKKGLTELLKYLRESEIPAAVATSTAKDRAEQLIKEAGVYEYFTAFAYGDLVEKSKPEPDIFLAAAAQLGADPRECLVLEDSAPGVMAGKAAGGYTIYIPDVSVVPQEAKQGITAQVDSLLDVINWIEKENHKKQ